MSPMRVSEFMLQLAKHLQDARQVTESTTTQYLQTLFKLNGSEPFKTLAFLKNTEAVQERIDTYAPSTQGNQYVTIVSILGDYKTKPGYKKAFSYYSERMNEAHKEKNEKDGSGVKTEKQSENWVEWKEVQELLGSLQGKCGDLAILKNITPQHFDCSLSYLVLALYTLIQPRRNQDYLDMYVVKKLPKDAPTDKNYLDLQTHKFVFNKFKTSKKYGQQVIDIPDELMGVINMYLRHHPLRKSNPKLNEYKLLVKADGSPMTVVNSITRILNKIFGKNIGSSMLRHIYLTNKYENDTLERQKDSVAMGHSVSQQGEYIKPLG